MVPAWGHYNPSVPRNPCFAASQFLVAASDRLIAGTDPLSINGDHMTWLRLQPHHKKKRSWSKWIQMVHVETELAENSWIQWNNSSICASLCYSTLWTLMSNLLPDVSCQSTQGRVRTSFHKSTTWSRWTSDRLMELTLPVIGPLSFQPAQSNESSSDQSPAGIWQVQPTGSWDIPPLRMPRKMTSNPCNGSSQSEK